MSEMLLKDIINNKNCFKRRATREVHPGRSPIETYAITFGLFPSLTARGRRFVSVLPGNVCQKVFT